MADLPDITVPRNLIIKQRATFVEVLTIKVAGVLFDFTDYAAEMELRDQAGTLVLRLDETDGITLGGVAGTVTITIAAADTEDLADDAGGRYDLLLTAGATPPAVGTVTRLMEGEWTVSPSVTQPEVVP